MDLLILMLKYLKNPENLKIKINWNDYSKSIVLEVDFFKGRTQMVFILETIIYIALLHPEIIIIKMLKIKNQPNYFKSPCLLHQKIYFCYLTSYCIVNYQIILFY